MIEIAHAMGKRWINRQMVIILTAIVAAGTVFTWWTARHADRCVRENLLHQARIVANAIRPERVDLLTGTADDLTSPTYRRLNAQLAATRAAIPKCQFVYLLGRRADGAIFFLADSESKGSKKESPPGQVVEAITDADRQAFTRQVALTSGPRDDRRGRCISALVPIKHPDGNRLVAVLGVDFDARDLQWKVVRAALPPVLLTLVMALVLVIGSIQLKIFIRRSDRSVHQHGYLQTILTIAAVGLFLGLSTAWVVKEKGDHVRMRAFRQLATDKTAVIASAFRSLHFIELEALARFFEASQYVTPAEFRDYTQYLLKNPAIQYWAWVQWTPASDREAIDASLRAQGRPDGMIWQHGADGQRNQATARDVYFPIVRVALRMTDKDLLGYDLGSDLRRRTVLEAAMQSGLTTCMVSTFPVNDPGGPTTVEIYRPTYYKNGTQRSHGFGMAVLVTGSLLHAARPSDAVQLTLAMGTPSGVATKTRAVASDTDRRPQSAISLIYPVFAFGEAFLVTAQSGSAFRGLFPAHVAWLVLFASVMLTALLALLVAVPRRKREQLESLIAERTRDLVEARHRMSLAINGADLGTWEWHKPSDTMTINDNYAKMAGYDLDEVIPRLAEWRDLIVPEDRPKLTQAMQLHLNGQSEYFELEHRVEHKAGHDVWVLSKGRVIERDADGHPVRVCGTCLDTTKQRAVKEALKVSEARLRTLLDTLPDMIWLKDPQGVFLACNKRFERLYGAEEADIIGKTDYAFVEPAQADFFREKDQAAVTAGKPCLNEEEVIFADDGHKELLETIKTPMFDAQGRLTGVLGIARDITERRRAQEEREHLQEQLLQAQKIEAVGQLAGGVAHDLNNLLAPIIGYAELLLMKLDRSDKHFKALDVILSTALRARELVRQLLAFSRKQTLEVRPIDINQIIRDFHSLLLRTIPEDIAMEVVLTPHVQTVMADAGQIEQVIMNLSVNAADAMPSGGRLTIETEKVDLDETFAATHPSVRPGPHFMLAISDTGCGMDEATTQRIFEPFFSTKGERGTGLGLATVFGIVKQHNGSIWVYSEPGSGTTFKVYLPVVDAVVAERKAGPPVGGDLTGGETILLVEDNQAARELAREILALQGYTILTADNGHAALAMAAAHEGPVHLLLTDVVMPGMNGKELYEKAVARYSGLKVLYMSGYTDDVIAHRGLLDDGIAFIQKPFTIQAITTKVREVLDQP